MIFNKRAAKFIRVFGLTIVFVFVLQSLTAQSMKKKGRVTIKFENGKVEASGKVKNYKKQGIWKYYSMDGKLQKLISYKDDLRNGLFQEYYVDGKVSVNGNYNFGSKDGEWISYYNDGKLSSKFHYDGVVMKDTSRIFYEGLQQWWYENGQLREESFFVNHLIQFRHTFYNDGKKRAVENYKLGVPDGTWRKYPEPSEVTDTLPASIDNYINGKKDGVHLAYFHGRLSEEVYYQNDKLNGTLKKWDAHSDLGISENYVNGNLDGICKYFNYGKCIREVEYLNGKISGTEKEFDGRGEMYRISWFKTGIIDSSYNYHKNGKLAISRTYKYYPGFVKTEEFSIYTECDTAGILLLRGTYHFEAKDKEWKTFYPNGKLKSITPWTSGKIKGVYRKWYTNGKLMIEFEVDGGNVVTQPKVWDEKGRVVKVGTKYYDEIVDSSKPGEIYNDPKKYKENRTTQATVRNSESVDAELIEPTEQNIVFSSVAVDKDFQTTINSDTTIYQFAEVMPEFPGGSGEMMKFIQGNIIHPSTCIDKQGTVIISFIVEKDGSITHIESRKDVTGAPEFTKEAIRVVSLFPKFVPGKMRGRPIRVQYNMPVRFT